MDLHQKQAFLRDQDAAQWYIDRGWIISALNYSFQLFYDEISTGDISTRRFSSSPLSAELHAPPNPEFIRDAIVTNYILEGKVDCRWGERKSVSIPTGEGFLQETISPMFIATSMPFTVAQIALPRQYVAA